MSWFKPTFEDRKRHYLDEVTEVKELIEEIKEDYPDVVQNISVEWKEMKR